MDRKIEYYLNPKRLSILEEEGVDIFDGRTQEILDCKTVFMNAVLHCSKLNNEELSLTQKDLAEYLGISETEVYRHLERHSKRHKESENYRDLSDKWKEKFCGFDGCDVEDIYTKLLIHTAKKNSERINKKIFNMGIEVGYIIDESHNQQLSKEENFIINNDNE